MAFDRLGSNASKDAYPIKIAADQSNRDSPTCRQQNQTAQSRRESAKGQKASALSGFVALTLLLSAAPRNMPDPQDGAPYKLCTAR